MDKDINILLVQNNAIVGDRFASIDKVCELLESVKKKSFDLIVFPELWNVGWNCDCFSKMAEEDKDSITLEFLSDLAQKYDSNVLGGSYIRKYSSDDIRNTCPIFNRNGDLIATYDKMHLFDHYGCNESKYVKHGKKPVIVNTDVGKIGLSICYDIRFPELFRKYSLNGADIMVNMAAWPKTRDDHWITLQKARAIENQSFMISVSQTGPITNTDMYNLGHSMVIDPFGKVICSLEEEESTAQCKINLKDMKELRKAVPTLSDIHKKYDWEA